MTEFSTRRENGPFCRRPRRTKRTIRWHCPEVHMYRRYEPVIQGAINRRCKPHKTFVSSSPFTRLDPAIFEEEAAQRSSIEQLPALASGTSKTVDRKIIWLHGHAIDRC